MSGEGKLHIAPLVFLALLLLAIPVAVWVAADRTPPECSRSDSGGYDCRRVPIVYCGDRPMLLCEDFGKPH